MLGSMDIVAFVPTRNRQKARPYYEKTLGLPAPFTILGWSVEDIGKTVKGLGKKGVKFERYPGTQQDQIGVRTSPSGAKVAWFKDPDGNVLSVTES